MSKQADNQPPRSKGRPRGITKLKLNVSMDMRVSKESKKVATRLGESFSQFVQTAVRERMESLARK